MIRNYALIALAGFIAIALQTTVWNEFFTRQFMPDLIFVLVVLLGLYMDPVHGSLMAFGLGYLQDVMSGELMGTFMTCRMLTFIMAQVLSRWFMAAGPVSQFLIALGLGFADKVVFIALASLFGSGFAPALAGAHYRGIEVFINAGLTPFVYILLSWLPGPFQYPAGLEKK